MHGSLPGIHRADAQDPPAQALPGGDEGPFSGRAAEPLREYGAAQQPVGHRTAERTKWCSQMQVKPFDGIHRVPPLRRVRRRFRLQEQAGHRGTWQRSSMQPEISWGILGKDEMCCGDSLRRLGNEFVFDKMARDNVKMFKDKGVKKIITMCPHCFSTLKNDYKQYGFDGEVIHHADLINDLLPTGKLKLKNKRQSWQDRVP